MKKKLPIKRSGKLEEPLPVGRGPRQFRCDNGTGAEDPNQQEPTRIVVVGSGWHFMSGISLYTCRVSNALLDSGYAVSVILMRKLLPRRFYPGRERVGASLSDARYQEKIKIIDGVDYYWGPSLIPALRLIISDKPEIILFEWWTSTVLHTYLLLALLSRVVGTRVFIEFHEVLDTAESRLVLPGLYSKIMMRPLLWMAEGFVVHSEFDRRQITHKYSIESKPVATINHGPYDHLLPMETVRSPTDGKFHLLYFGTIRPYKGVEYLIEAFNGLSSSEVEGIDLTVVGETWEGWTLPATLIQASQHAESITFVNRYVTDAEAAQFFAGADVVVLPYLRSSASGPLHIAMSHGLPVIVSDVGGLSEVSAIYKGAYLVKPTDTQGIRDAIRSIASHKTTRYEDPFSWQNSADQFRKLFDRVSTDIAIRGIGDDI